MESDGRTDRQTHGRTTLVVKSLSRLKNISMFDRMNYILLSLTTIILQENLIERCTTPLFEMMLERPSHMYSSRMTADNSDINVDPDDSTGMDYEQLSEHRKYDSDNEEFEIL